MKKTLTAIILGIITLTSFIYPQFSKNANAQTSPEVTLNINTATNINPFNAEMLGLGLVNWEHSWGKPFLNDVPGLAQAFRAANIKLIRYAGGLWSNNVGWERIDQRRPNTQWTHNGNTYSYHYGQNEIDSVAQFAQAIDAHVMIEVNINSNDPTMWADMVRYTNIDRNYRLSNGEFVFKYWELGNEFNLTVWDGSTPHMTPAEYVNRLPGYISAMKTVDPSIKIIAGVPAGAHGSPFVHNWDDNFTDLSEYLKQSSPISGVDSLSYHWYMQGNNQNINDMFFFQDPNLPANRWRNTRSRIWSKIIPNRISNEIIGTRNQTQGVTELNYDSQDHGVAPQNSNHANAVWAADVLGRLAYNGTDFLTWYQGYGTPNQGYPAIASNDQNGFPTAINLRPSYYTFFMYGNYFGDQIVESNSSNESSLSIWASTDSKDSGKLKIMIINTSNSSITASLDINGYNTQNQSANIYQMTSDNPTDMSNQSHDNHSTKINNITLNSMNVANSAEAIAPIIETITNNSITINYPAYSVTAIILDSDSSPTPTTIPGDPTPTTVPLTPIPPTPTLAPTKFKSADFDKDRDVDRDDYNFMKDRFFGEDTNALLADINNDNRVDIKDYSILVTQWGSY